MSAKDTLSTEDDTTFEEGEDDDGEDEDAGEKVEDEEDRRPIIESNFCNTVFD